MVIFLTDDNMGHDDFDKLIKRGLEVQVVCPDYLKIGVFKIIAKDNKYFINIFIINHDTNIKSFKIADIRCCCSQDIDYGEVIIPIFILTLDNKTNVKIGFNTIDTRNVFVKYFDRWLQKKGVNITLQDIL